MPSRLRSGWGRKRHESSHDATDKGISRRAPWHVFHIGTVSPAGRLLPPVGIIPGHVRSLHELHLLLAPDERSLPGINLTALADWVGRVIGDEALAVEIAPHPGGGELRGRLF